MRWRTLKSESERQFAEMPQELFGSKSFLNKLNELQYSQY